MNIYLDGEKVKTIDADVLVNRGLFFGEAPFTTALQENGKVFFAQEHVTRLQKSFELLFSKRHSWLDKNLEIQNCLKHISKEAGKRYIRITMFEDLNNQFHYLIVERELDSIDSTPVKIQKSEYPRLNNSLPTFLKFSNYLEGNIEKEKASENGFEDILFFDPNGFILEATTSNVFFRKGSEVFTPEVSLGLLEGITRKKILELNPDIKIGNFKEEDIKNADEVWLTNSLSGLRSVSVFEDKKYVVESEIMNKIKKRYNSLKYEEAVRYE